MTITHPIQLLILVQLLYAQTARFSELNQTHLANSEFTYHINQLLDKGMLQKRDDGTYALTTVGINEASRIDYDHTRPARIPKVGVYIYALKKAGDKSEVLLGRKLRDPNMGKVLLPGQKIVQGKTLRETAQECLLNKTGLSGDLRYMGVVHFRSDKIENGFDRIMHIFAAENLTGELTDSKDLENFWVDLTAIGKVENKMKFLEKLLSFLSSNRQVYAEIRLD